MTKKNNFILKIEIEINTYNLYQWKIHDCKEFIFVVNQLFKIIIIKHYINSSNEFKSNNLLNYNINYQKYNTL